MATTTAARMYSTIIRFGTIPPIAANEIGKNTPAVLPLAWKRVTSRRLPRVLLYNQVYKTASTATKTINQGKDFSLYTPTPRNFGKCQTLQITPRIRLAVSALYLACRRGRT